MSGTDDRGQKINRDEVTNLKKKCRESLTEKIDGIKRKGPEKDCCARLLDPGIGRALDAV